MALINPFKLHKLKIKVYGDRLRTGLPDDTFTVMFNPASISMRHENKFNKVQGINTSGRRAMYSHSPSTELRLDLTLDGTGVTDFGISTLIGKGTDSVADQIDQFLGLCFSLDGKIHEPKFLKIQWGDGVLKDFDCRLQSVDIEYTSFDRNGAPLHAILKTAFVEDLETSKRLRKDGKSSPDLSHTRIVKSGDSLPLLSKEIYGSSRYYLRVAQVNNLDDFRNLTPGQTIVFPPLERES
jgi:LysM repeat protein